MSSEGDRSSRIARVRRAFSAAAIRFAGAPSFAVQEDEASNMLHHLYRMYELAGDKTRFEKDPMLGEHAAALVLYRHKDVHAVAEMNDTADIFTDYFTDLFATLVWATAPELTDDDRWMRFDGPHLIGRCVLTTLHNSFDAVEAIALEQLKPNPGPRTPR